MEYCFEKEMAPYMNHPSKNHWNGDMKHHSEHLRAMHGRLQCDKISGYPDEELLVGSVLGTLLGYDKSVLDGIILGAPLGPLDCTNVGNWDSWNDGEIVADNDRHEEGANNIENRTSIHRIIVDKYEIQIIQVNKRLRNITI